MEYGPFGWCHSPLHDVTSDLNTIPVRIFFPIPASHTTILASDTTMILPITQSLSTVIHGEYTHSVCRCIQFYTCTYWKTACFSMIWFAYLFFFHFVQAMNFPNVCWLSDTWKDEELHASQDDEVSDMAQDVELATIRWCTKQMVRFTDCQLLNRISEPCIVLHLNGTVTPQGNLRSTPKATPRRYANQRCLVGLVPKSLFHGEVAWDSQKICKTTLQVKSGDAFMLS